VEQNRIGCLMILSLHSELVSRSELLNSSFIIVKVRWCYSFKIILKDSVRNWL